MKRIMKALEGNKYNKVIVLNDNGNKDVEKAILAVLRMSGCNNKVFTNAEYNKPKEESIMNQNIFDITFGNIIKAMAEDDLCSDMIKTLSGTSPEMFVEFISKPLASIENMTLRELLSLPESKLENIMIKIIVAFVLNVEDDNDAKESARKLLLANDLPIVRKDDVLAEYRKFGLGESAYIDDISPLNNLRTLTCVNCTLREYIDNLAKDVLK